MSRSNVSAAWVAALLLTTAPSSWAINKCPVPGGKFIYQDLPCEGAQKVDLSGAGKANESSSGSQYWRSEIARQKRADQVLNAIHAGQVFVGMTADEARQSWGNPTRVNTDIGEYGRHEQWVYRRGGGADQYLYVKNGIVTSIQDRP